MENHKNNSKNSHLQDNTMKHKVILFPLPFQGHINPMLQLANILHSKGFSITIIHTNFNSPNPTSYPHFDFYSIPDGLSDSDRDQPSVDHVISLLPLLNVSCVVPFKNCLAKLLSSSVGEDESRVCCLITDAVWHFSQDVANELKIPRIVLRTSSISSFLVFATAIVLREKGCLQDLPLESLVPELPPLRVKDIPFIHGEDPKIANGLVPSTITQTKASSGCIWNSFQELEESALTQFHQDFQIPTFPIGPFHKYFLASSSSLLSQDTTSISWLDKQAPKSVLYVSFGSVVTVTETEFAEIAWGLANSRVPFLWVVRSGTVSRHKTEWVDLLPEGFNDMVRERGHIVKWAPQQEVLAHEAIGGFWTHSGWNSTLESICEGVPMICQPCFGDQLVISRYVSDVWRVGVHLEGKMERKEIERLIRRVIMEDEGKEMRERIMGLKDKVDLGLREGGSSYRSLDSLVTYIKSL